MAMAKFDKQIDADELVQRARTDAEALGRLYDLSYEKVYHFCLCRLFHRETAEDVTSAVFLTAARGISGFKGGTLRDFTNWLYQIAANHANSHIRKTSRRKELFARAARSIRASRTNSTGRLDEPDWPVLYAAIAKLKVKHQCIITLRFFENLDFDEIAKIMKARPATVRVT
ncbi:MAG: RNA polymerase sigma factor, partial [Planctomycetota bacterium]